MKKIPKFILLSLGCTLLSVVVTLAVVSIRTAKMATGKLKATLKSLFPDYDWEFTGVFCSINKIRYTVYYEEGFPERYPDAETLLRDELIKRTPGLAKAKLSIQFIPRAEFKY